MERDKSIHQQIMEQFKCCVIIPTYNNESTLKKVIDGVLTFSNQIIIVNDGSTDKTSDILRNYQGLTCLELNKNSGKGIALRAGFQKALEQNFDYAITIDADDQHNPEDIPVFLDKLKENPESIIIGARNMDQSSVPGKSSFGHRFSNFWFWVETGYKVPDTQSGFRLYPLQSIRDMKFYTSKYEFEIEIIVRAAWKKIKITSVPINVYYAPKEERVSHFRPFTDFTRVSLLNTWLVIVSLLWIKPRDFLAPLFNGQYKEFFKKQVLNTDDSNLKIALSISFGLFMGVTPIWGYQLAVAIPLAFLFRLRQVIVIIAAHISFPPFIPFVIYFSYYLGGKIFFPDSPIMDFSFNISFEQLKTGFIQYALGSFVLGLLLALVIGPISYLLLFIFRTRLKNG